MFYNSRITVGAVLDVDCAASLELCIFRSFHVSEQAET
jgi:hypothetical protein